MNFQKFITFLGAKISFKYEEYFDPKNGKCVIKKNRLALKRKGQDSIGAIREAFEALPKEIWRSDKYFKIGNLTIIQVKFTGFYLWQIAKPNMDYLFDPDAFADIGIRFVDETWLTNKIYLKYNCISDSF